MIVTASLLLNFYAVLFLKIYDQRRQLDILTKDTMILRNIDQVTKEEACKSNSTFLALKQFI